eukprot:SM006155S20083  [mRNA]  locus=s6155:765:779:+ [translate_table: standard]
MPTRP